MSAEILARWQFGITTVYHFFFVPLTIALSMLVAILQSMWVKTGDTKFLRLTKFYGKLLLINFAMGVVTGIVQEFQFGMNWSEYSRFVGDIFGAPLAFEALISFFLESTFLGLWIFGWDRLSKKVHLLTIWMVAIGTLISSIFILAANSFMQNPVGAHFNATTGRAELTDFGALFTNPVFLVTFPHVIASAWMVACGFVAGIAAWHLARINRAERIADDAADESAVRITKPTDPKAARAADTDVESGATAATDPAASRAENIRAWRYAAKFGAIGLIIASLFVIVTGDLQGKVMTEVQPMKMAAAEALYEGRDDAPFSIFTVGSLDGSKEIYSLTVPNLLSFLGTGNLHGHVEGINDLNERYTKEFTTTSELTKRYTDLGKTAKDAGQTAKLTQGRDHFNPNIPVSYWSFRFMIGLGMLGTLLGLVILLALRGGRLPKGGAWWNLMCALLPLLPLFAISFGWIFTEMGRQPWIVFGVLPTMSAVSPTVTGGEVLFSVIVFTLVYGAFAVVEVGLMNKFVREGLPDVVDANIVEDESLDERPMSFAY